MNEPKTIVAGDTITWNESFSDYPAPTWTLTYELRSTSPKISITATTSGTGFLITIPIATSVTYDAGRYSFQAFVSKSGERHMVSSGTIEVLPNLATKTTYDSRSHVRKVYEALQSVIEGRVLQSAYTSVSIGGRAIAYMPMADLRKEYYHYKQLVKQEEDAEKIAKGLGGTKILVRF
mgnify:CR=1 FL=1